MAKVWDREPTTQELFDEILGHILTQTKRCERTSGPPECAYRNAEAVGANRECAVGHVIPDECYVPEMEGLGVFQLARDCGKVLPSFFSRELKLLVELQALHDGFEFRSKLSLNRIRYAAREIAQRNNLEFNF